MNRNYIFAAIAVVVLGCIQATSSGTSSSAKDSGIAIQDFFFKAQSITDEEKVGASFIVANVGSKTVTGDIYAWFYGPFLGKTPWEILSEGTPDLASGEAIIQGETFFPPVPERGIPGSTKKFDILLQPPKLPQGTTQKYTFYAEVCYPYTTTALAEILSTSQNEYTVQVKSDMSIADTRNTLGPLKLKLSSRKNIRTSTKVPIVFSVEDNAGGYPTSNDESCTLDIASSIRDKADVSVFVDGSSSGIDCGNGDNKMTIDLVNKKGLIFCTYELPSMSVPKKTFFVTANAEYKYYARKSAEVSVESAFAE